MPDEPKQQGEVDIKPGILATAGAIGALLAYLLINLYDVSKGKQVANMGVAGALPVWILCGAAAGVLRPRYGILIAVVIATTARFLVIGVYRMAIYAPTSISRFRQLYHL